jgi:hypothetical protein
MASVTERLSIEINVTEEHLKRGTLETNPGQRDILWKNGTVPGKMGRMGTPCLIPYFNAIGCPSLSYLVFRGWHLNP